MLVTPPSRACCNPFTSPDVLPRLARCLSHDVGVRSLLLLGRPSAKSSARCRRTKVTRVHPFTLRRVAQRCLEYPLPAAALAVRRVPLFPALHPCTPRRGTTPCCFPCGSPAHAHMCLHLPVLVSRSQPRAPPACLFCPHRRPRSLTRPSPARQSFLSFPLSFFLCPPSHAHSPSCPVRCADQHCSTTPRATVLRTLRHRAPATMHVVCAPALQLACPRAPGRHASRPPLYIPAPPMLPYTTRTRWCCVVGP